MKANEQLDKVRILSIRLCALRALEATGEEY